MMLLTGKKKLVNSHVSEKKAADRLLSYPLELCVYISSRSLVQGASLYESLMSWIS